MLISEMMRPTFWLAALQIMGINILLSGDNAVVIALAVRGLPPKERFWGMVLGAGCAAVLLILFTGIVATLLKLPYLKLIGGLALFWVAVKLVAPQPHDAEDTPGAVEDLWRAVAGGRLPKFWLNPHKVIPGPPSPTWKPLPPWPSRPRTPPAPPPRLP